MRLGVFLLLFAIILATASSPAAAQLAPPAPPDVETPGKDGKPPKKAKKPPPGGEEGDPDGAEGDPDGEEGDPDSPDGEEGDPDGEEGGTGGEEGGTGGEEGGAGGESGSPELDGDGGPGSEDPAGLDRSTDDSGSTDEDTSSYLASQTGCSEDCDPPGTLIDRVEGDAILSAAVAEPAAVLDDDGLSSDSTADGPVVLALFALMGLLLLAGLSGGLRALHGRIRGG